MKNLILLSILISIVSCNRNKSNDTKYKSEAKKAIQADSFRNSLDSIKDHEMEIELNSSVLVDVLTKFEDTNEYYIALGFKNQYSDSIVNIVEKTHGETIFQNELESRVRVPDTIAQKYFSTNGLDQLIVFNKKQAVIDTISLSRYEFYSGAIESGYVATYGITNQLDEVNIAISTNTIDALKLKKVPEPISIPSQNLELLKNRPYDFDEIFSQTSIRYKSDTITVISFGNYSKSENYLHLYKNGNLTDSITNDYLAVSALMAIPLATESELTYVYSGFKPDTDWLWNGLMGIDLKNWKLVLYEENRIKR